MAAQLDKKKVMQHLNQSRNSAKLVSEIPQGTVVSEIFSSGNRMTQGVVFDSAGGQAFDAAIDLVLSDKSPYSKMVGRPELEEKMGSLLRENLETRSPITITQLDRMLKEIQAQPESEWDMSRALFGATDSVAQGDPLQFGPFTIFDWSVHEASSQHDDHSRARSAHMAERLKSVGTAHMIKVRVRARDKSLARAKGDEQFALFEAAIRYMIGRSYDTYDVGIFDYNRANVLVDLLEPVGQPRFHSSSNVVGTRSSVNLRDPIFVDPDNGNDRVWTLIEQSHAGSLPDDSLLQRVLLAVVWVGKAVRDQDPGRRLVQLLFALEALFSSSNKDVPITDRLAECAALVACDTRPDRKEVARVTKEVYGKRSAVAHGRRYSISEQDIDYALQVVKLSVRGILTRPELATLDSKGFDAWMVDKRYRDG